MAALSYGYVKLFTPLTYSSIARFYVGNQSQSSMTVDNSTLNAASSVTADCVELIRVSEIMMSNIVDSKGLDTVLGMEVPYAKAE